MSEALVLAGRGRRLTATLIDMLLVPSLTIFLVMVAGVVEDAEDYRDRWWILSVLLIAVLSYVLLNGYTLWRSGQTLGKKVMGIAMLSAAKAKSAADANSVADANKGRDSQTPAPLWKLICIRALFFPLLFATVVPWVAALPIIDQLFIFRKQRRCLHDLAAGTVVVRLPTKKTQRENNKHI